MATNQDLLKSFIIGASPFVFIPFYFGAISIPESLVDFKTYAMKASVYFGLMNMLATYYGKKFNLSLRRRLIFATIFSISIIWTILTIFKPYEFETTNRWIAQYILVAVAHTIAFAVIIYNLELLLI